LRTIRCAIAGRWVVRCSADPSAEFAMRRRTCGATLSLLGRSGMRVVRADEFIVGELETACAPTNHRRYLLSDVAGGAGLGLP